MKIVLVFIFMIPFCLACNVSITTKQEVFNDKIGFRPYSNADKIEYWVESVDGEVLKAKKNTTRYTQKSFSPKDHGPMLIMARVPGCNNTESKLVYFQKECEQQLSWVIRQIPARVEENSGFEIRLEIFNKGEEEVEVKAWSHIYRGSKCYSVSRKHNLKNSKIPPGNSSMYILEERAVEPGNYWIEISIKSDGLEVIQRELEIVARPVIEIANLSFEENLYAQIRNGFDEDKNIRLVVETPYSWQERNITLPANDTYVSGFAVELYEEKNPVFVKLYSDYLVDVQEIVVYSESAPEFFNCSNVYKSSSQKVKEWAIYFVLIVSVIFNLYLLVSGLKKLQP